MGPSDLQWNRLLDFIEEDHELRTGEFSDGPNGKERLSGKWNDVSNVLNDMGPARKSGVQWKEAFYGLRSRARQAYADQTAYVRSTGGGERPEVADVIPNPVFVLDL